jgi:ATP phosphoribosyltransferase
MAPRPLWFALPDGHLQGEVQDLLERAGLHFLGYNAASPGMAMEGVRAKTIRPQDMPFQVACGNFDLAITGKDWTLDHLYRFPSSPVREMLDLDLGRVKVVAVVSQDVPADTIEEFQALVRAGRFPRVRVASEYVNLADRYAGDHHLVGYRIVPTWGATEAFLPEDADLLIENTQTGTTLAQNNLKVIDTLFVSTARLITNAGCLEDQTKAEKIQAIAHALEQAVAPGTKR